MQPLKLLSQLKSDMIEYISSKYPFFEKGRADLDAQLRALMSKPGTLFQDPVIQLVRQRRSESSFDPAIFQSPLSGQVPKTPYTHQIKAWRRLAAGKPTVVATGTGSGKSECFMFPVIDGLMRQGFASGAPRVGAICLYPMNALVEDQFFRLLKLTAGTGIRVGIYNGTYRHMSEATKTKILERAEEEGATADPKTFFVDPTNPASIPHILLTNFKMLEYMLLRTRDHQIFAGSALKYLVLDEAHTYSGTLGLEIACLLARLRVHLGESASDFVPVATSATLAQRSLGETTESAGAPASHKDEMRDFFSQLFGREFPDDGRGDWLIEDEFEPLPRLDPAVLAPFLTAPLSEVRRALATPFPEGLRLLTDAYFGSGTAPTGLGRGLYDATGRVLHERLRDVASHIATVVLSRDAGGEDPVLAWDEARARFAKRLGADSDHLEGLLTLASQAYENDKFPALGLRIHLFGRSEPRVYWSMDGQRIADEEGAKSLDQPTGAFIACRKCGHMAWAGVYTPTASHNGQGGRFDPLPAFYEDAPLESGATMLVLHRPSDVQEDIKNRKGWDVEAWGLTWQGGVSELRPVDARRGLKAGEVEFWRILRESTKKDDKGEWIPAGETAQCPACGSTSSPDERPVLMTPRSGAATDLSVYASSVMTNLDLPHERRLLIFSDNRQETAFLAGFMTDRHRRFNLRRVIASFLKAAETAGDPSAWRIIAEIDEDEAPKGHKYDFAARVLLSLAQREYWGTKPLPRQLTVSKRLLQEIIPRDVLEVDYRDRKDKDLETENENKNWLLDNISHSLGRNAGGERGVFEQVEVFGTDRGRWALQTLHEVILMEVSAMVGREGNLRTLGLASWSFPGLKPEEFEAWAASRPELALGGHGLLLIAHWLMSKLAENAQWQAIADSSRRHVLGRRGHSALETLQDLFGKNFNSAKGIAKASALGRLLTELGGEAALKAWSSIKPWHDLIDNGPLKAAVHLVADTGVPKLKTKSARIINNPQRYRGSISGAVVAVDPSLDLASQPTGRKDEMWVKVESRLHEYYRSFYQRSFADEARLVRAHEHNGMIGGDIASEVISRFERDEFNTLVATPTLEMGVDLPDLPTVFHRSVPPDASNYAQRAGRAGRGPKRAFIVTHCGFGSHDLTFYEDPRQMVSGEILPPGLPSENLSIIRRHVQGLVIEVMAKAQVGGAQEGDHLTMTWWGDLVDLSRLQDEVLRVAGTRDEFPRCNPADWQSLLGRRREAVRLAVAAFTDLLSQGLWSKLEPARRDHMRQETMGYGQVDRWAAAFRAELDSYVSRCESFVADFKRWQDMGRTIDKSRNADIERQMYRAYKIARMYLGKDESNYPLSYLGSAGFLPNFDFPGKSIRFIGVLPQFMDKRMAYARDEDKYLTFSRPAAVALREFAPEQKIYGQGFVYRVDRYEADNKSEEPDQAWGICLTGCSQLSTPGRTSCEFCGGELVHSGREAASGPVLVEISGVQGLQDGVISDRESKRSFNGMVKEIRHRGIPAPDHCFALAGAEEVRWSLHQSPKSQIKTATVLSGARVKVEGGHVTQRIVPVYREVGPEESRVFRVRASAPEDPKDDVRYQEFLPTVWGKGQALVFAAPYTAAEAKGWIVPVERSAEGVNKYYKTLSHLISRAATRVLRLNKRKASLQFLDHQVNEPVGDGSFRARERFLLVLDSEEGGSGVIQLLWDYWDAVMDEAHRLVVHTCCADACYRCLKSYDNQYDHGLLDKSQFFLPGTSGRESRIFREIKKASQGTLRVNDVLGAREQTVDSRSPAEASLEHLLRTHYGLTRTTQVSIRSVDGREITRPDFVFSGIDASAGDVCLFVDGWTYHHVRMRSDMEKRNSLAQQHLRTMVIPARLVTPNLDFAIMKPLLDLLLRTAPMAVPTTGASLPFVAASRTQLQSATAGLPRGAKWEEVRAADVLSAVGSEIGTTGPLYRAISQVDGRHFPVGHYAGYLLWPLYIEDLERPESKAALEAVLMLQAVLAGLGGRHLFVEAKSEAADGRRVS